MTKTVHRLSFQEWDRRWLMAHLLFRHSVLETSFRHILIVLIFEESARCVCILQLTFTGQHSLLRLCPCRELTLVVTHTSLWSILMSYADFNGILVSDNLTCLGVQHVYVYFVFVLLYSVIILNVYKLHIVSWLLMLKCCGEFRLGRIKLWESGQ